MSLELSGSIKGELSKTVEVSGNIQDVGGVTGKLSVPTGRVISLNYEDLTHRPLLNGVLIEGNKQADDYSLQLKMNKVTDQEIDEILYGGN